MSRALAIAERAPLDFYATPAGLADAICGLIEQEWRAPASVIEPSAGHGPFIRSARARWPSAHITAVDVASERSPECVAAGADDFWCMDWPEWAREAVPAEPGTLIVGNPPFREAQGHVEAGLEYLDGTGALVFLLRLNLLGAKSRIDFWRTTPLAWVAPVIPRPSFTGGGTDATEYAAFCWRKDHAGHAALLPPLLWARVPRARQATLALEPGDGSAAAKPKVA